MKHQKILEAIFVVGLLCLIILMILLLNKTPISTNESQSGSQLQYEKAKILEITREQIETDEDISDLSLGTQTLKIQILTGLHKGEVHEITNYLSSYYNVYAKISGKIIVSIDTSIDGSYIISVYNYHRSPVLVAFTLLLCLTLWLIGKEKGLKSIIGLLFTYICIMYIFIPMLFKGFSPILASIVVVVLSTCVTLYLLNGWSKKTFCAIVGTVLGVIIAGIISAVAGVLAHISGYNTEEAEMLILIAKNCPLQVKGLLFSGILIASLGAIMDVGMSISSAIFEIHTANPKLKPAALFKSGLNVGKDMIGTMSNTLLLAFTGTSLNTIILFYANQLSLNQLLNMDLVSIEIIQGLAGTIGIVLTVPIIAFISSRIIPKKHPSR